MPLQSTEAFDRFEYACGDPAYHHLPTAPALHVPFHVSSTADQTLGRVGGRQRPPEGVGQIESEHRECFIEAFTDALGRTGMIGLESPCEVGEKATGRAHVGTARGAVQDRLRPGPLALRQVIEEVAQLVRLAALDERDGAEEITHRFPQGFRAIEDHQEAAVRPQPAALQMREERLAEGRLLRGAFPQAERVFLAVGRNPQRHDEAVLPDVDAIEDEPDQVEAVERLRLPRFQLGACLGDESPAHGALARSAAHHWSRHRFQTTGVLTGGDPHQHLFDHTAIQRIAVGERLKGRQRDFGAIAAGPWPANRHLPATQDDFARHRAGARRLARNLMLVPRTADRRSVFLEHRREHLQAGGDGELHQLRSRIDEQIDERQMALGLGITVVGLIDCARLSLHGGSLLAGLRPGLVTTRVSRAVRSRRSQISTAIGTSPVAALEEQDWAAAVEQINQALEQRGDSGVRVRTYGMRFTEYFPYLKLGIAYYHLGQFEAALQAFETEQRLEAIGRSASSLAELQQFRSLTEDAMATAVEEARERVRQNVRDTLAEARTLEAQGQLGDALRALGRGLAVAPDDPDMQAVLARLQSGVRQQAEDRQIEARVAQLVVRGRSLLEAGRYPQAATLFREALSLRPSDEIESLLGDARERLRTEIQGRRSAARQQTLVMFIEDGLKRAAELEAEGQLAPALDQLRAVIAVDPSNEQALAVQIRLLGIQDEVKKERARRDMLEQLLAEATADFDAGRFEQSLSAANRALALDSGNSTTLEHVGRAYREINNRLLGAEATGNIPPAIRFADFREELDDGSQVQIVRSPDFRLSGVIIDNSPVEVTFHDGENREVPSTASSQPIGEYYITEFSLNYEFESGLSAFRLVATDSATLRSSSEYLVVYDRPFFRSGWFYSGGTVALLALVVGYYGMRARRRRQLLTRRFNPYVAGAPVLDENMFFGRQRLLDRVLQTVHNNSLLLYGERRIGKTSLQHHLKRRLENLRDPQFDFYPVYIDLQGTPQEKFFATLAEDIFQELGPHLECLKPSADTSTGSGYAYRDFVRDTSENPQNPEGEELQTGEAGPLDGRSG